MKAVSPAQLGGMLPCLVITHSAADAALPRAIPPEQQCVLLFQLKRRKRLGAVVLLAKVFRCLLGEWIGGDAMGSLKGMGRRKLSSDCVVPYK